MLCVGVRYELVLRHTEAHMTSAGKKYSGPSMIALASELLQIKITCLMNCIYCHIRKSQWTQALKLCERIVDDSIAQGRMSPIEMLRLMYFKCFAMINSILNATIDDMERVQNMTDVKDAVQDMLRLLLNSHVRNENNFKGAMNDFREIFELYTLLGNAIPSAKAILDLAPEELSVLAKLRNPSSVHDDAVTDIGIVGAGKAIDEADIRKKAYNHEIQETDLQAQQVSILGKHLEISEKKRVELILKHRIAVAALQAEKDEGARQLSALSAQLVVSDSKCAELLQQLEAVRAQNEENKRLLSLLSSQLESSKRVELLQLLQQEQEENLLQLPASPSIGKGESNREIALNESDLSILRKSEDLLLDEITSDTQREAGARSEISQKLSVVPAEGGVEIDSVIQSTNIAGSKGPHDIVVDGSDGMHSFTRPGVAVNTYEEPNYAAPAEVEINTRLHEQVQQRIGDGLVMSSNENQFKPLEQHLEVEKF